MQSTVLRFCLLTFLSLSNIFATKIAMQKNDKKYAYVGLGEDSISTAEKKIYLDDFYKYDQELNTWIKLRNFPSKRNNAVSFIINNEVYVGCGQDDGDIELNIKERYHNDFYKYQLHSDNWIEIAPFPEIYRKYLRSFVFENQAFVGFGKFGAKNFSEIYKYDHRSDKWSEAFSYEAKSNPKKVFSINGILFFLGNEFLTFDSTNNKWTKIKTPENLSLEVSFVIDNKIYVGFGRSSKKRRRKEYKNNLFYSYSYTDNKWVQISSFPGKARKNCISFTINGKGYIGMGQDLEGNFYNNFYLYNPELNTWQEIAEFPGNSRIGAVSFVL